MSELAEPITQAPESTAIPQADLTAAFAAATPYNPQAEPAPQAEAPVAVTVEAPVVAADAPSPASVAPPVEAPPVAAQAPDYAAYLRETFGAETPEALKEKLTLAEQAETLKANQRTDADRAFEKLLADPKAATAFVKLQTTDFNSLPDRELHAAAYAHKHPELTPEVAAIRARREFEAEFAAADFDDADDPQVQEAKVLLAAARAENVQTMEQAKEAAKTAVLSQVTPTAEGPSAAELEAQADEAARVTHWTQGVEQIVGAEALELEYQVDGQAVKLAFDNKNPAFKEAMLDPVGFIAKQVTPTGDWKQTNYDRAAEIVALLTQPDVLVKNAFAAGKASLGAVIPLDRAVNPTPAAPQAPATEGSVYDSFRQAEAAQRSTRNNY